MALGPPPVEPGAGPRAVGAPEAPGVGPRPGDRYGYPMPVDFEQPRWEAAKYPGRHVAPVGAQAGARELAANVYELDPGAVGSPLHVHHANEELLLVLSGTPTLRSPEGTQLLSAGAVIAFPRGHAGAHSLVNRSDAPRSLPRCLHDQPPRRRRVPRHRRDARRPRRAAPGLSARRRRASNARHHRSDAGGCRPRRLTWPRMQQRRRVRRQRREAFAVR